MHNDPATAPRPRLAPPQRLLMGPGPSDVHPDVYRALGTSIVGHLDPAFLAVMDALQSMLREVFQTRNRVTLSISGTGSAGMEAAFVNLVQPGDEVLVGVNGVFGGRMADIVGRLGARLVRLDRPWGQTFTTAEIAAALEQNPAVRVVALVHAETSTGALQPLAEIGRLCRDQGRYFLVDAVTSLGGAELAVDDWMIDVCYSGTQKCLSCPPGLAPITFSDRAVERIRARERKAASWYLDLNLIDTYWTAGKRAYHHTAPISMNYALHEALRVALEEGLEARFERHRANSRALVAGLEALGFEMFVPQESERLPMLHTVTLPAGVADVAVRRRLLEEYGIEIGAGLGEFAGKIWRIGLMGESSRRENVIFFLSALEALLLDTGAVDGMGAGVEAAARQYSKAGTGA